MSVSTSPIPDENHVARRNALLYTTAQALGAGAAPVSIALGGLVGSFLLGADKSLATAPVTAYNIGVAMAAIPAALMMRKLGRRLGFMGGTMIGVGGMLVAAVAIYLHSFWLFAFGLMLNGSAGAFTQQYRFAAADRGTPAFRAKAISWVLAGGIAAAVIGPQLVLHTRDLLAPIPFAGAFLAATSLFIGCFIALNFLDDSLPPPSPHAPVDQPARPLSEILAQPRFIVAVLCGTGSYALMSLVMTAAPLAMVGCGLSIDDATLGIQWHVMAMFAPSFFTGSLIARYGKEPIVALGLLILVACAVVALMGIDLAHFWIALILLGVGWNFGFIGATAMVTDCYRPSEKAKAQGANDFILFSSVALASFSSGLTLNLFGWETVNWMVFPVVTICLLALGWLVVTTRNNRRMA